MTDISDTNSYLLRHRSCSMMAPVLARASESRKMSPMLRDEKAVKIESTIQSIQENRNCNGNGWNHYSCILKTICYDRLIKDFIWRHPEGTILNIGCALDTTFDRLKPAAARWYDLDFPEIISVRKLFFKESPQRTFISSSFLSDDWIREISFNESLLAFSCGFFCYYDEIKIREFFEKLIASFPSFELLFDVKSPSGLKAANRSSGKMEMDCPSLLKWGVNDYHKILRWNPRIVFLGRYRLFNCHELHPPLKYLIRGMISDAFPSEQILHLRIRYDYRKI